MHNCFRSVWLFVAVAHSAIIGLHGAALYPFAAIIRHDMNDFACTGSLIDHRHVLSAAMCLPATASGRETVVELGDPPNPHRYFVLEVIRHPSVNLALYRTMGSVVFTVDQQPVVFDDRTPIEAGVRAISLHLYHAQPEARESADNPPLFAADYVVTLSNEACQKNDRPESITATTLCAYNANAERADLPAAPCQRNIGGPLLDNGVLIAFSTTAKCSDDGPNAFERVAPHVDWIRAETTKL